MTYEEFLKRYQFDTQDQKAMLGAGGFGSVYKAYDSIQKRFVAIKIAEVKNEKFNLLYEKQIVDELDSHENVARYGNCFRFQFMPVRYDFAVLTFYEEGNLADVLSKYALDINQKHEILTGILKGVGHLHKHHIIHRDMKPQNVLMEKKDGRWIPKLTDFGLSKLADTNTHAVENSSIGLSIAFAAPEQIKNREIRHNVDLWAVGVIAYQMFVGELPFEAPRTMSQESWNLEVSKLIVEAKMSDKISKIPEPYQTVIKKCLVADNLKRVQRADDLLQILESFSVKTKPENIDDEKTMRIAEPFSNTKELARTAELLVVKAGTKAGYEKDQILHEAIKIYEEILRIDPANRNAILQLENCREQLKKGLVSGQLPVKKLVFAGVAAVMILGIFYFFNWKSKAEKDITLAKAAFFAQRMTSDTLQTYPFIFQTLSKYAGTIAMDDTTNNILGIYYQNGRGGAARDYQKAIAFYDKGGDYEWAKHNLGYMSFWGLGTEKNFQTAADYFEDAYNKKQLIQSADYLGAIYRQGDANVQPDYTLAKSWFEKGAAGNSSYAQQELGKIYLNGLGVVANSARARYYFGLAAAQGNRDAQQSLKDMDYNRSDTFGAAVVPNQNNGRKKTSQNKNAANIFQQVGKELFKNAFKK